MSSFAEAELLKQSKSKSSSATQPMTAAPGRRALTSTDQVSANEPKPDAVARRHELPPPKPGEDPAVASARQLLQQTERDPGLQLLAIRRVLERAELAEHAQPKLAIQLLQLLAPFGADYPAVASAVKNRLARLEADGHKTTATPAVHTAQDPTNSATGKPAATTQTGDAGPVVTPADRKVAPQSMTTLDPDLPRRQQERRLRDWEEDKKHPSFRDEQAFGIPHLELFKAISAVDLAVPLAFRRMMVGQVLGEQSGKKPNRNFAGIEFPRGERPTDPNVIWTRLSRSDEITEATYHADPDKYYDNHAWGQSILVQLNDPKKRLHPDKLMVNWYSARPAYDNWDDPSKFFHNLIMTRHYHKLLASPYPEHQDLAHRAWAGDPDAYLDMLELNSAFDIRAANAPKTPAPPHDKAIGKYSYNGTGSYKKTVIASVTAALNNETFNP